MGERFRLRANFDVSKFSPEVRTILTALKGYLDEGQSYAATLMNEGRAVDPDVVAAYLAKRMGSWDPTVNGGKLLDDATRHAGARFLAGVAVNLVTVADTATRRARA